MRRPRTTGGQGGSGGSLTTGHEIVPSRDLAAYVSEAADLYLAPELTARTPDPVALYMFGLGVLGYLIFTGRPPAHSQAELGARLQQGKGRTPSALVDGLSGYVDELVRNATDYNPLRRPRTAAEFLESLDTVDLDLAPHTPGALSGSASITPGSSMTRGRWSGRYSRWRCLAERAPAAVGVGHGECGAQPFLPGRRADLGGQGVPLPAAPEGPQLHVWSDVSHDLSYPAGPLVHGDRAGGWRSGSAHGRSPASGAVVAAAAVRRAAVRRAAV
ncbi:hypothetical protein SCWH03_34910 [Streptomyces pacificus]|uniref:Protein kinase domain-containing protein n=1 Tax=Streptomyces pacificus TaxID=2705029 RepID=A0A6A0AXU7_9ACTN|nr:hypothetical protein SCWH03_34910 [Streptomyces pacificus]